MKNLGLRLKNILAQPSLAAEKESSKKVKTKRQSEEEMKVAVGFDHGGFR